MIGCPMAMSCRGGASSGYATCECLENCDTTHTSPLVLPLQLYQRVTKHTKSANLGHVLTPVSILVARCSGAARGGKLPPYGWTSKNYVICVCTAVNVSASGGLRTLDPL